MIRQKLFWSIIAAYLILGCYIFFISIHSPVVGIEVEKQNNNWVISDLGYPEVGKRHGISVGATVREIDNRNINEYKNLQYGQIIRSANSLTIENSEGESRNVLIKHSDLPIPFLYYFILPLGYFIVALFLAIYLFYQRKGNHLSLHYLILFILTVALAYSSIAGSTRLDRIGVIVNSTGMILSLVFLIYFLKSYFQLLNIHWSFLKKLKLLYLFPIFTFLFSVLEVFIPEIYRFNTTMILIIFGILLMCILMILILSMIQYRKTKIKVLFWGIVLPFSPFLFLFVLPEILFKQHILSSTASALFLLLIPFGFIFVQLNERLFDIDYHISRFRYYLLFSTGITVWIVTGIYVTTSIPIKKIAGLGLFILGSLIIFFYIKEKIDYVNRKVLFSPRGDYIHLLYSTIDEIKNTVNMEELFGRLCEKIAAQLELKTVYNIDYDMQTGQFFSKNDENLHESLSGDDLSELCLGKIIRSHHCYAIPIHQDSRKKHILILGSNGNTRLKNEEILWIELLTLYVSNFIDNTRLVEDLLVELNLLKQKGEHSPAWLNKLVWMQLEEEKHQLAQELHDTILQEQIFLIREVNSFLYDKKHAFIPHEISDLNQQLIDINTQLRSYCEKLKPPLLDTLGLNAALNKLFMQTKQRAEFTLIHSVDSIDSHDSQMLLLIYRVIQEMLSNAVKHSNATYVKIQLSSCDDGIEIFYMDNGVGCDLDVIAHSESMGLKGMKERVLAFNGYIEIDSYPNEGMQITIKLEEG